MVLFRRQLRHVDRDTVLVGKEDFEEKTAWDNRAKSNSGDPS